MHGAFDIFSELYAGRTWQERVCNLIRRNLVELCHVVDDPVQLFYQTVHLPVCDGQLRQLRGVQHVIPTDRHALSHSRSSPAYAISSCFTPTSASSKATETLRSRPVPVNPCIVPLPNRR